jgi:hypothetical protein
LLGAVLHRVSSWTKSFVVCASLLGCASSGGAKESADASGPREGPVEFSLAGVDGSPIESGKLRGRVTVLLFVTTFDVPSQAQAKRLEDLYRIHAPRLNAVAVIIEAPRYVDLARSYREVLGLNYAIAMADKSSLAEHPQFRYVNAVPSWIFLDREGMVSSVASGALSPEQLVEMARRAE